MNQNIVEQNQPFASYKFNVSSQRNNNIQKKKKKKANKLDMNYDIPEQNSFSYQVN